MKYKLTNRSLRDREGSARQPSMIRIKLMTTLVYPNHCQPKDLDIINYPSFAIRNDHQSHKSLPCAANQEASRVVTALIQLIHSCGARSQLAEKGSLGRIKPCKACYSDNELYSLTRNCFLRMGLPSFTIMYPTASCMNAEDEAQESILLLKLLGLSVKTIRGFAAKQLFEEIKSTQKSCSENGQIIILMSHGEKVGIIYIVKKKKPKEVEYGLYQSNDTPQFKMVSVENILKLSSFLHKSAYLTLKNSVDEEVNACKENETTLDCGETQQQKGDLFSSTPQQMVCHLIEMIPKWRRHEVVRLTDDSLVIARRASLQLQTEFRLQSIPLRDQINILVDTMCLWERPEAGMRRWEVVEQVLQEDIVKLLAGTGITMPDLDYPLPEVVIHYMLSNNQSSSIVFLLDQVTSPHRLLSIIQLKDLYFRLNFLSNTFARNNPTIYEYLMRRLSSDDVFVLLCEQGRGGWTGLHCAVDQNDSLSEILSLLNDEVEIYHLLSIKDHEGQSALSFSIAGCKEVSFQSIIRHYSYDQSKLMELASIKDVRGNTSFHYAAGKQTANFLIPLLKSVGPQNHWAIFARDGRGLTLLSYCIYWDRMDAFQAIIGHYTRKQSILLKLATITDNAGNTSFHYAAGQQTSRFLIDLIKFTCSSDTRAQLANVLSQHNHYDAKCTLGRNIVYFQQDNQLIYDWAFDSITNNRYLLCDLPSVLIMYTTAGYSNAETEAQAFITSLKSVGLDVKPVKDFTKERMFEEIENSRSYSGTNGQIIVLMSHGVNGAIADSTGKQISLRRIELEMDMINGSPKVLITQCCQTSKRQTYGTACTQTVEEMGCLDYLRKTSTAHNNGEVEPGALTQHGDTTEGIKFNEVDDNTEECETPQMCTDDDPGSRFSTYFPTSRNFSVLMSCSPCRPSLRNRFIPALGEALLNLKLNENMATLMMPVKRSVREASKGMQAPSLVDLMEFDFCIKNILPIYLSFKRRGRQRAGSFPASWQPP